jgi:SAM-dependent methyltransferase
MEAIINEYKRHGVDNFYRLHGSDYENPHRSIVESLILQAKDEWNLSGSILDLCCGSGEVSNVLKEFDVEGIDPYTCELYMKNTRNNCIQMSFKDIVRFGLGKRYDFIICSYAMHLCEPSMLAMLLYRIAESSNNLIIITPHKKPNCDGEFFKERTRMKKERTSIVWYESKIFNESFCFM